jgi:hypothetical protein
MIISLIDGCYRGIPHSIQALEDGVEFMLVFDDGSFSETNTFLATEIFAHNPVHPPQLRKNNDKQ